MNQMKSKSSIVFCLALFVAPLFLMAEENNPGNENNRGDKVTASSAKVNSVPRPAIEKISHQIDYLVEAKLAENDQQLNKLTSDEVFVRRIYLDVIGRIPTLEETRKFLNSKNKNKRADLIDELLDSYGYVSRQFNFFADLLRIKTQIQRSAGQPYVDFVKDSLEQNKPYDDFVRELLTAEGAILEEGNGAVGYYLRDYNMPEDNMSNTVRVFLGTRLECAQCHDHPFDKWTQKQYFEMVAFTGGLNYRAELPDSENARELVRLLRDRSLPQNMRPIIRRMVQPITYGIDGNGTGLTRLPEDYMGNDGNEYDVVKAQVMFGDQPQIAPEVPNARNERSSRRRNNNRQRQRISNAKEINSRTLYAEWLTDSTNPRFATVIANRLWKQTMGLGLIEPVDIIEDNTTASNPRLMEYLTESMIELGFDMKQFLRAIYNSRTYQSEAFQSDVITPNQFYFNGPIVRRMSGEQIWDSMITLAVTDVDFRSTPRGRGGRYMGAETIYEAYDNLLKTSPEEIKKIAKNFAENSREARQKMTQEVRNEMREELRKYQAEKRQVESAIKKAQKQGNQKALDRLIVKRNEMISDAMQQRGNQSLIRASELPSPAPAGHFLREFGQSDREQIENANTDPSVTQVLALMNGFVEQKIANDNTTVLMRNVFLAKTPEDKIQAIFMTLLNRKPTRGELKMWQKDFQQYPREAVSDLIWTLVNTNEFMFVK